MKNNCAYCLSKENVICKSHAIPNYYFRKTKTNGSSIVYRTDDSKNALLNESGDAKLLCDKCESEFNIKYDNPLMQNIDTIMSSDKITPSNSEIITKGLLSILWRASKSDATIYQNFTLDNKSENVLKKLMTGCNENFKDTLSLRIRKIYFKDSSEDPSMIITSPIMETIRARQKKIIFDASGIFLSFGGLYFELFIPSPSFSKRFNQGFVSFRTSTINLKKISFLHTANGYTMAAHMKDKDLRGHATLALQKLNYT